MQFKAVFLKLIILLSFCPLINLQGQENYFSKTFTTENGLPHNHVYDIVQDQNGFIWIATWDGLSRYDGYEFKNYYHNLSDTTSIAFFWVRKVLVDFQNNVWVFCSYGISRYNRAADNFTRFLTEDITDAALDRDGKIWVNSPSGLYKWNYKTSCFEQVPIELNFEIKKIIVNHNFNFRFDNENRLWVIVVNNNNETLYSRCNKHENNGLKAEYIGVLENYKYLPDNYFDFYKLELFVSKDSCIWQLGNYGIFKFDSKQKKFIPFPGFIAERDFTGLSKNDIQRAKEIEKFYKQISQNNKINSKTESQFVETCLVDGQKTVWQSVISALSQANGLIRNIPVGKGFKHYFFEQNPETGLNPIFPVLKDRFGTIWAGPTNVNQFFRMDKNGKTNHIVPLDNETWRSARQPRSFLEDSAGIWIGYFNLTISRKYD